MEQRFILRLAEIDDIPSIMEIEQICFDKDSFSKRQFVYLISQAKGYFCVVEYQQRVGGYFSVLINQRACSLRIYSIAVHPDFRGKKVGQLLIDQIAVIAQKQGLKRITLEVNVSNSPAIHLYEKITSTRKIRIFFTNYGKVIRILVHGWRFCSIYEANDCFTIHIPETVSFINSFDSPL